jgi:phosphonate transport system permease protein
VTDDGTGRSGTAGDEASRETVRSDGGSGETGAAPEVLEMRRRLGHLRNVRRVASAAVLVLVVVLVYYGLQTVGFDGEALAEQWPVFVRSVTDFVPPNFRDFTVYSKAEGLGAEGSGTGNLSGLWGSLARPESFVDSVLTESGRSRTIVGLSVITVIIGFVGTCLGAPLALLFGVLGSERVTPFPFNFLFRGTMSTIRAIPALVWILVYIPLSGLTPLSAVLAIATDTVGNLGRLFTDELEEIRDGPIEAITSTGGSRPQVITFGMLSQVRNSFVAWTLYILEINVRIAISLGVVGAGGIGQYIDLRIQYTAYDQAAAGIFMVVVIVLSVELFSSRIRAWLRPGSDEGPGLLGRLRQLLDPRRWLGVGVTRSK